MKYVKNYSTFETLVKTSHPEHESKTKLQQQQQQQNSWKVTKLLSTIGYHYI